MASDLTSTTVGGVTDTAGTDLFAYDPAGRMILRDLADADAVGLVWDASSNLVGTATGEGPGQVYVYDASGQRVAQLQVDVTVVEPEEDPEPEPSPSPSPSPSASASPSPSPSPSPEPEPADPVEWTATPISATVYVPDLQATDPDTAASATGDVTVTRFYTWGVVPGAVTTSA